MKNEGKFQKLIILLGISEIWVNYKEIVEQVTNAKPKRN